MERARLRADEQKLQGESAVIEALVEAIAVYQRRHDARRGVGSTPASSAP